MSPSLADLAVIIVNWNTRQLLLDCLAALPAATAGIASEVWVVDNGSSDGSVAAVRAMFPKVQVIANAANLGFAAANNQAIRASTSYHVLLLNSDTLPAPGALAAQVRFLDANPGVGMVGPCLRNGDGSVQLSYARFPTLLSELRGRNLRERRAFAAADGAEAYSVDWVGGASLIVRRTALEGFGLLDEGYFMYTEEQDWCYRARQAGWAICYLPGAEVVHLGGQSSRMASSRMKAELYKSKLRFFRKHYGQPRTMALGLCLQAGFLAKTLLGGLLALAPGRAAAGQTLARDSRMLLHAVRLQLRQPHAQEAP